MASITAPYEGSGVLDPERKFSDGSPSSLGLFSRRHAMMKLKKELRMLKCRRDFTFRSLLDSASGANLANSKLSAKESQ